MTEFTFSPNPVVPYSQISNLDASQEAIEMTPNLRRCSMENAYRYGGKIVRQVLEHIPDLDESQNIYVETISNFLLQGHIPTQPGWHLDEIPRAEIQDPMQVANVDLSTQLAPPSLTKMRDQTHQGRRVKFHTIIVGNPCPTKFIMEPLTLDIVNCDNWGYLQELHEKVKKKAPLKIWTSGTNAWHSWDWWNLHCPSQADMPGWRLLVRIVEGGQPPMERDFFYPTHHVFVPSTQSL